jgi:transcriptional regulator of arginine metabolism
VKNRRQLKILEIVQQEDIHTQAELVAALLAAGIPATQATVSRDIKELGLVKTPSEDGRVCYTTDGTAIRGRERLLLQDCLVDVDVSENLVVLRTMAKTGALVAAAVEGLGWREVIGTVADERSVLLVVKPKERAVKVAERLRGLVHG